MKLMGHTGVRRNGGGGSPMGRVYRERTPAMLARVTAALDERIARALELLEILRATPRDRQEFKLDNPQRRSWRRACTACRRG